MLKRELKINIKELLIWSLIVSLMLILVFCVYPYIIGSGKFSEIDKMLKMFPPEMLEMFNMNSYSMSTAFGWIKTEGYVFIVLFGSIYSSLLGSSVLSKEEKEKTIEFLGVKPVSRNKIITSKIISAIIYILLFSLIIFIVSFIGLSFGEKFSVKELVLISFAPLLLYYIMFSLSLFISTILKNQKRTSWVGLVIVFVSYIFQIVGTISDKVKILREISFFEFVSLKYILDNMKINYIYLLIGVILIVLSIIFTYIFYNKKELV